MSGGALIAALPMYDFPGIAAANDAMWAAIAVGLCDEGSRRRRGSTRGGDPAALWRDPGLVFGQTCGYPYVKELGDAVVLIATPEYGFPGCEGARPPEFPGPPQASDPRRAGRLSRRRRGGQRLGQQQRHESLSRRDRAPCAPRAAVLRRGRR